MIETIVYFLAQSVIILLAIITAHVATKVQIAKLEVKVESLQKGALSRDKKIEGMSRHLAELTGKVTTCPHLTGNSK